MTSYKMLVLTDHSGHSKENSLYDLVREVRQHPLCANLDVASRGIPLNELFFNKQKHKSLFASETNRNFEFHPEGVYFKRDLKKVSLSDYDVVWLRLPPPLSVFFLEYLKREFPRQLFINDPKAIHITGSKAFLLQFPDLCPPMKLCTSIRDIIEFKNQFPIVLKPLREYGGRGILKIQDNTVWEGNRAITWDQFVEKSKNVDIEYLGVQYLKNVSEGDKRIVVINGQIMGASLRLPKAGSWICNVAQGGSSNSAQPDADEIYIINTLNPVLSEMGIVMYGVDTLVNDAGKRVCSEINTTSIGGISQISQQSPEPIINKASHLIWDFIQQKIKKRDVVTS